ncbi:MAG TPA: protein kinase [Blastocatellia bacterium]|nr:protein kinase [Blastocatellia bacterium]
MTLATGTKLGRYEIRSKIGEGGMGEVYRATDLKLNRDVAIKVLPRTFLNDAERLARFQREAQVLASLNHTNIAAIYGVEEENGFRALVMELVEGPTLADRIAPGPIPLDDALEIARQIAEALEAAHERGIIHRDLKPANVKVTPEGTVKVLDFGLAKVFEGDAQVTDLSHSPTLIKGTQAGVILGTAAYMSPEQAKGKAVDRRADIWAFGCVLFEMLSGKQTFSGETLTDTLAAVVRAEPEWETLPQSTPDSMRRLLRRCLTKDPKQRLRDIGEARIVVSDPELQEGSIAGAVPAQAQSTWKRALPWAMVVLLAASLLAIWLMYVSHKPNTQPLLRASINLPTGFTLDKENSSLALSPDGKRLVFAASGSDGTSQQLWIRSMDSMITQSLPGTNGATYPFWSPDGRFVGFFADKKLKKTEISTGTVQNLCDAIEGRGATWSKRDVIVFAYAAFGPLSEVSAAGGTPVQLTSVERADVTHRNPHFLPDGKRLLFFRGGSSSRSEKTDGIYSLDLETKTVEQIANEQSEGIYLEPGYLIFVRDGNLMAQPIDTDRLRTSGQAIPIAEKVFFNPLRLTGGYSLSATGLLVFDGERGIVRSQLTWFDIEGKSLGTVSGPASFISFSISPDGKRAEALVLGTDTHTQLWMFDLNRGIASRFTSGSEDFYPGIWSPDGRLVAYSGAGEPSFLYLQPSNSSSEPQKISTTQGSLIPTSWSPNGEMIVFNSQTSLGVDLWIQPLNGDKKAYPFLATPANEIAGTISPDGHWIAFISNESGRYELYVTSFPSSGVRRQISSDGADAPQWLNGGSQLAYINAERKLIRVNVNVKGQEFVLGESHIVFGGKPLPSLGMSGTALPHPLGGWDVPVYISSDGMRILLPVPLETNAAPSLTLVTNWTAALQR